LTWKDWIVLLTYFESFMIGRPGGIRENFASATIVAGVARRKGGIGTLAFLCLLVLLV
jgi:hypothetical protein